MRRAGKAIAQKAMSMTSPGSDILILAGKGNNGGDAKYAVDYITERHVTLIDATDPSAAREDLSARIPALQAADGLLIDGLFGIGLNRPFKDAWLELIHTINSSALKTLAVDVPSGLDCDSGETMGAAVQATATVTFGAPKTGMIRSNCAHLIGRLELGADIGLIPCPFDNDPRWTLPNDFTAFPPPRPETGHKGSFGHLAIIAGSQGYHGAAAIAARSAHRSMPGLISVFTTPTAYPLVGAQLQQSMVHPWTDKTELPPATSAILMGPGLAGPDVAEALHTRIAELWQQSPLPIVADASALDRLPPGDTAPGIRIITPHPGEASRMLGIPSAKVQEDRIGNARRLSTKYGDCHVILKGAQTITFSPAGQTHVNSTGNPGLAQGGSGDALAGLLAGLLAQPCLRNDLDRLIRYAVWEHGHAADRLADQQSAWDLEDFIPLLGNSRDNQ